MKKIISTKTNIDQAKHVLDKLYVLGVRDFVVCPGGRNAPFVQLLEKNKSKDISVHWGFEERSASFFALGLTMKHHQPVAVFTTSGTAFVETTSAILEAHYLGLPLIVVSSDRPEFQWGSGAPQTMIQKDFLKSHLGPSVDHKFKLNQISLPLHINCSFDEPLLDQAVINWTFDLNIESLKSFGIKTSNFKDLKSKNNTLNLKDLPLSTKLNPYRYKFFKYSKNSLSHFLKTKKNKIKTLFIFSGLEVEFKEHIKSQLKTIEADLYFEATGEIAGLENQIHSQQISKIDVLNNYQLVVRVGGIPTHRIWRDFEIKKFKNILHFSNLPLPGLSFGQVHALKDFEGFLKDFKKLPTAKYIDSVHIPDLSAEQSFFKSLKTIDKKSVFYIGNSLPIRHWDTTKHIHFEHVYANRGLNGIDGQLSTALGLALKYSLKNQKTFAVLGDLTSLYDLSAPWYWKQNKSKLNFCLVIINNSGGQIFSKMFDSKSFLNEHNIRFKSFAEMWGLSYLQIESGQDFENLKEYPDIIEFKVQKQKTSGKIGI